MTRKSYIILIIYRHLLLIEVNNNELAVYNQKYELNNGNVSIFKQPACLALSCVKTYLYYPKMQLL